MPCGSQQREELGALIRELELEGQVVPVRPKAKAKPALEPSPFGNWDGPWSRAEKRQWGAMTRSQKNAWTAKHNAWKEAESQKKQTAKDSSKPKGSKRVPHTPTPKAVEIEDEKMEEEPAAPMSSTGVDASRRWLFRRLS